jgi:aspartate/methionine/tyrosine aminotransferase
VFITPGFIFGDGGKRYIRISLCCTVELLQQAKQRISAFLSDKEANVKTIAAVKV